jgi:DNA-binding MurR/RpiR family transcriptional regulator
LTAAAPKLTVDALLTRISAEYDDLSKQLKVIARRIEQNRHHLGIIGIRDLAAQCEVQPSAIVRFAKHFGFSGFTEMQRIFREGLAQQLAPNRNYEDRIRKVIESGGGNLSSVEIANEFLGSGIAGMQQLRKRLDSRSFNSAVNLLAKTETIWLAGSRRSFSVAAYLDYALQHTDKRIMLMSAIGSMQYDQVRAVRKNDVMIAISYRPYAEETVRIAKEALKRGARLIAITDSRMSPLARDAQVTFVVEDNLTLGFRSLSSTMGLAESLFIALAYRLELPHLAARRPAGVGRREATHRRGA